MKGSGRAISTYEAGPNSWEMNFTHKVLPQRVTNKPTHLLDFDLIYRGTDPRVISLGH